MDEHLPMPGVSAEVDATPSEFLLDSHVIEKGITIVSTARDAGNTVTTTLRPGLMLSKVAASGKYTEYTNSGSAGAEVAVGILKDQVKVLDPDGVATDAVAVMVIHGRVKESALHGSNDAAKVDLAGAIIFD